MMATAIILSISITDASGNNRELTISEDGHVLYRAGGGQPEELEKSRRDADDFVWEIEGFLHGWRKNYGQPGTITAPGNWMVVSLEDRAYLTYRGCFEYPSDWESFLELIATFIADA